MTSVQNSHFTFPFSPGTVALARPQFLHFHFHLGSLFSRLDIRVSFLKRKGPGKRRCLSDPLSRRMPAAGCHMSTDVRPSEGIGENQSITCRLPSAAVGQANARSRLSYHPAGRTT